MANLGQFVEIGQGHAHQREQIRWTRRAYILDTQTLRLDLLSAAKDEIRAHYDTYVGRLDTLLVVDALLWPFALASLQFAQEFVPQAAEDCPTCVEAENPWMVWLWVWIVGMILVLPFWSILMIIRCKLKLDGWLEFSLANLNQERRMTVAGSPAELLPDKDAGEAMHQEMEQVVSHLGGFIVEYQDHFARVWSVECKGLVDTATALLWLSAVNAIALTALMIWIWMVNRPGEQTAAPYIFAMVIFVGFSVPAIYIVSRRCRRTWEGAGWDISMAVPSTRGEGATVTDAGNPLRDDASARREPLLAR